MSLSNTKLQIHPTQTLNHKYGCNHVLVPLIDASKNTYQLTSRRRTDYVNRIYSCPPIFPSFIEHYLPNMQVDRQWLLKAIRTLLEQFSAYWVNGLSANPLFGRYGAAI